MRRRKTRQSLDDDDHDDTICNNQTHFNQIDPEWGDVNRLRRGALDLPLGGGPDTLGASYGRPSEEDGRIEANNGDGFVMIVAWDQDGNVSSQSIHQFGSATLDEESPHYADQSELFAEQKLKPVVMDEALLRENAERIYRPNG